MRPGGDPEAPASWRLVSRLAPGTCGIVKAVLAGGDEVDRLKAMGICEGRKVMLVRAGDPLILRVLGTRIGVSERLAAGVQVMPCGNDRLEPRRA